MSWKLTVEEGRQIWQYSDSDQKAGETTPKGISLFGLPFMTSGKVVTHSVRFYVYMMKSKRY